MGSAYDIVLGDDKNYDERYFAFSRAFEKAGLTAPPELLIELARCADGPDDQLVSCDQAIEWLKKSFRIEPYSEAASLLSLFYSCKNDEKESDFWKNVTKKLVADGKNAPPIEPDFVRE